MKSVDKCDHKHYLHFKRTLKLVIYPPQKMKKKLGRMSKLIFSTQ